MKKVAFLILLCGLPFAWGAPAYADCKDTKIQCWGAPKNEGGTWILCGQIEVGACYNWTQLACMPCAGMDEYTSQCSSQFPNCANEGVYYTYWMGKYGYHSQWCAAEGWVPPYQP